MGYGKMIDLKPTKCNLCGGKVILIKNDKIYDKIYGSGYCYYCECCGAYVGTNKNKPDEALGILANGDMRKWKQYCHRKFDVLWKGRKEFWHRGKVYKQIKPKMSRSKAYMWLSKVLDIPSQDCHFGYFTLNQLKRAYAIMKQEGL